MVAVLAYTPANELLAEIRNRLAEMVCGDPHLLFAYRGKVAQELQFDEPGKPSARSQVKAMKNGGNKTATVLTMARNCH